MSKSFSKNVINGIKKRLKYLTLNPYRDVNISWFKLKYYKHLPTGPIRSHRLKSGLLYFYNAQELLHGLNEIFIEHIYKQNLSPNSFIIDCGANIGMSVIYMKDNFPDAEIIAFEPDEFNFNLLTKNISSFGYSNVKAYKQAVWKENTTLHFSNDGSMGSKIVSDLYSETKQIEAVRLYDFLDRNVDFLKIDIEGAEYEVLKDIASKLYLVNNLFLEYHGKFEQHSELTEIVNIINAAGFQFYIKEAASIYDTPFYRQKNPNTDYDVQLNIFCFRK